MVEMGNDGWSEVQLISTGEKGIVPSDYIFLFEEEVEEEEVEEEPEVVVFKPLLYSKQQALPIIKKALKAYNKKRKLKVYMDSEDFRHSRQRNNLIREILESERTYVNYITVFQDYFLKPLKTALATKDTKKIILDDNQIKKIFSNCKFFLY